MDIRNILETIRTSAKVSGPYEVILIELEKEIVKCFKQRELLEDAIIVYRMQRAPTRRVWYINVGQNRGDRAKDILKEFRDEITQNNQPLNDVYNAQSILEDIYLPMYADGSSSRVESLDGSDDWNNIPELQYFTNKMTNILSVYIKTVTTLCNVSKDDPYSNVNCTA